MKNWSERIKKAFKSNKVEREAEAPRRNLFLGKAVVSNGKIVRQMKLKATKKNEISLAGNLITLDGGLKVEVDPKLEEGASAFIFNEDEDTTGKPLPSGKYDLENPKGFIIVEEGIIKSLGIE